MSIDMNIVIFGGRLTGDPELLGTGNKGCKFDMASNRTYRDKSGERQEDTTYMSITCWGPLGDLVMQNCRKADPVVVQGRIANRKFTDQEGNTRRYTNIVASDVRFVNTRPAEEGEYPAVKESQGLPPGIDPKTVALLNKLVNGKE